MKLNQKNIFILFILFFSTSCYNNDKVENIETAPIPVQTNEYYSNKDTFNFTDANGLKQGLWYTIIDSSRRALGEAVFYKDGMIIKK